MSVFGTMEITTAIGCEINCAYCPQSVIKSSYAKVSNEKMMSFDTFKTCIDKIPNYVRIDFSGMSEPWLNKNCTEMVLYAAENGHRIAIYTTLAGMKMEDFNRIKHIPFEVFNIHLPDNLNKTRIKITPEYLFLLESIIKYFYFSDQDHFLQASCQGSVHYSAKDIIDKIESNSNKKLMIDKRIFDRTGHIKNSEALNVYHESPIMCGVSKRLLHHNVLLPNGDVLLCCNDYGMEHKVGNLLSSEYRSLLWSSEVQEIRELMNIKHQNLICNRCHWAVKPSARYRVYDSKEFSSLAMDGKVYEFACFIAQKCSVGNIIIIDDIASIQLDIEFTSDDLIIIMDAVLSLVRLPQLVDTLRRLSSSVSKILLYDDVNNFFDTNVILEFFKANDIPLEFFGYVNEENRKVGTLSIVTTNKPPQYLKVPEDFNVIAIMPTYNEEELIIQSINKLNREGILVYVIDNWSEDRTYELSNKMLGKGVIGIEKWPDKGPLKYYDNIGIVKRQEELSIRLEADWIIRADVDEIRESPWEDLSLRDAIYWVDKKGYNAIDFTVISFKPIDNCFSVKEDLEEYFRYYEFSRLSGDFLQIRAWKKTAGQINLHDDGGHQAKFMGRKIYPYKFLLKHYPILSQSHGEKKLFKERMPRFPLEEMKRGWHRHYDYYPKERSFLKNPLALLEFHSGFFMDYLIERLSGIGIISKDENKIKDMEIKISERDLKIHTLSSDLIKLDQAVIKYNKELMEIKNSKSWKLALFVHRIVDLILPPGSARERFIRLSHRFFTTPKHFIKLIYIFVIKDQKLVMKSGFFAESWYLRNNSDVAEAKLEPVKHYLKYGGFEGRDPGPEFSSSWYLQEYSDVKKAGVNPLIHFLKYGRDEGRMATSNENIITGHILE